MATTVEGEDKSSPPAVIAYDPHLKPLLVFIHHFWLFAFLGAILLIAIVAGVIIGVMNKESSGPQEPMLVPMMLLEKSYQDQFVAEGR